MYFCIFKALFEKSKTEKSDEICKLANRNPTERNINVNYSTSAHNLVSSSFEVEMGGKSFIKKIGEMDLVPGHIHPYTVIISERDETIYVTVESGEVQGWVEGDRQEINTSDGNTITGVEPGDVQWDGGNTQTIVSQGGRSISMELYDN